ncbi:MAG: rhodanese-like domain-containing protein [Atopococcus tabaci]|uniref:Rhodanese-like domain-containing protein n=1 Tax=Atopococcus tabaci TaxID=269774 RepID=A0AA43UA08_9LACT|nr:rhodanese-like domain-containing protein [Atopococcus tabaci]
MDINQIIVILLILLVVGALIYFAVQYYRGSKAAVRLEPDEFSKDLRRVQLVDLREKDDYDSGHILGARNIPMTQLKMRIEEMRRDKPVYLYEEGETLTRRAALTLQKEGFSKIYRLKGGYKGWEGRIKRNK